MKYYPLFVNLQGKRCVVVGGGKIAQRKITSLLDAGAEIHVVSPACTDTINRWCEEKRLRLTRRTFQQADILGAVIVIAATNDPEANLEVYHASTADQWINIVDRPDLCTFLVPSTVRRGDLTIAISTAGRYPGLAKELRKKMEQWVGEEYADYTSFLGNIRAEILQLKIDEEIKRLMLQELLNDSFKKWTQQGNYERRDLEVKKIFERYIPDYQ